MNDPMIRKKLARIKLVAMDIDGTFTDGTLYYDSNGGVIKGFASQDGMGLELLRRAGILRGFISGRHDAASEARAEWLKADFYEPDIGDKGGVLERLIGEYGVKREECMFVGDDLNDLTAFKFAGIAVAVANAWDEARETADIITTRAGGQGAIREVATMLVLAHGFDPAALWMDDHDNPVGNR